MNEAFFSDALSTIIKMTLTGSIVTLLLFFVKPIIKNRLPKLFQYYTWLIVILAFMIPFSKYIILPLETSSLPIVSISEAVEQYVAISQKTDNLQESGNLQDSTVQSSTDLNQILRSKYSALIGSPLWLTSLLIIWSLGVFIFLGVNLFGYFSFIWKLLQSSSPARNEETSVLAILHKRPPMLYRNKLAPTPMLIGIIRPIIILPDKEYTPIQLKNILLHELIHFRRKDIFLKWIMIMANAIHWFNPFIYLVRRELNHICELACDESVIKDLSVYERQEYGNTLISVVAEKRLPKAVLSTTMSEEKKALKERLGAIMNNKNTTRKALIISVILFAIILCTTIVIGATKSSKIGPSKWDDFPNTLVENGFLSAEVVDALPDHRVQKKSDGSNFYLWSQWNDDEGIFIHKIELIVLNDELHSYIYTDYFFEETYLDTPLTIQEGTEMVERFADMFVTDDTLKFVNKPAYFSRYEEGHVESWVADDKESSHVIMVDLDKGCVIFYFTKWPLDKSTPETDPTDSPDRYIEESYIQESPIPDAKYNDLPDDSTASDYYAVPLDESELEKQIAEQEAKIAQLEEAIVAEKKVILEQNNP